MKKWIEESGKIQKSFHFENFTEAMVFVNDVATLAEEADHHPDILIHDYKHVTITLTSHSEGGVTKKDHDLAEKIDRI